MQNSGTFVQPLLSSKSNKH